MSDAARPLTIGLPVYDGAATIAQAIDSVLAQTRSDFELLVSDNASTDDTEAICRRYASDDPRVRYVRQPTNLGAMGNFGYLLAHADTPFFMWAACDDVWGPTFVERNLDVLEASDEHVCSVSRVEFVDEHGDLVVEVGPPDHRHPLEGGTFALEDTPPENLLRFLERPGCNTRFYGIHRTDVIRACYSTNEQYLASDWVVMARTLGFGMHHEVPEVLMRRSVHGLSSDVTRLIVQTNPSYISRQWFPMLPMTRHILLSRQVPVDYRDRAHLARLREILWEKNREEHLNHRWQLKLRKRAARAT